MLDIDYDKKVSFMVKNILEEIQFKGSLNNNKIHLTIDVSHPDFKIETKSNLITDKTKKINIILDKRNFMNLKVDKDSFFISLIDLNNDLFNLHIPFKSIIFFEDRYKGFRYKFNTHILDLNNNKNLNSSNNISNPPSYLKIVK